MAEFENEAYGYALRNALEFGSTSVERVLPKLFRHGLDKSRAREVVKRVKQIVDEVNALSREERERMFERYKDFVKERETSKGSELPELPGVKRGIKPVFRAAPFPSGALHIGNARTFLLNALYAEKYRGKMLLVMDDTIGSEEKQVVGEAYDLIAEAFDWLGINYEKPIVYKSDRLEIYYKYAEKLIELGKAYVCRCSREELRLNRERGRECACRSLSRKEQLKRWKEMFHAGEGSAVLRIKTGMRHENPAFRDRVLFKISERAHPRVGLKYRVWPTLEMSWAIDDHLLGITHIIRGTDLAMESEMERFIWRIFNWREPEIVHVGLIKLSGIGAKISKSKAQKEVAGGKLLGWDDPRTWSVQSLARRGIKPEAIREFVKSLGLTAQSISVPIETLYAFNRRIIDASAERYSFVREPVELNFSGSLPVKEAEVRVHPNKKETRRVKVERIFISREDFERYKGREVRLLHLFNVVFDSRARARITSTEVKSVPKINWVSQGVSAEVLMPNGERARGLAERAIERLKNLECVQFERFGFVSYQGKRKERGKRGEESEVHEFWFAHK